MNFKALREKFKARLDLAVASALFFAALALACLYFYNCTKLPQMYHQKYGVSLMVAAGKGFVQPANAAQPPISEFLSLHRHSLDPAVLQSQEATLPPTDFQLMHRYGMTVAGWLWRIFGIDWRVLFLPLSIFFAVSITAAYGIFRLAMPIGLSLAGSILLMISPVWFNVLLAYREFSKVPFALVFFLLIGIAITRPLDARRYLALCAALGFVCGIGLGFRQDLLVFVPAAIALLLLCTPQKMFLRIGGATILIAVFAVSAWPVLTQPKATNSYHIINEGLSTPFSEELGMAQPYHFGSIYRDEYWYCVMDAYNKRSTGDETPKYWTAEFNHLCRRFFMEVITTFPRDMLQRSFAAAFGVVNNGPFEITELTTTFYPKTSFQESLMKLRGSSLGWLQGWGVLLVGAAVLALAAINLRYGFAAIFIWFYFAGINCLQFDTRHFIHMEWLLWWSILFLIFCAWKVRHYQDWKCAGRRLAIFIALVSLPIAVAFALAHAVQYRTLQQLTQQYRDAPLQTLPLDIAVAKTQMNSSIAMYRTPHFADGCTVLVLDVIPSQQKLPMYFMYDAQSPSNDFSFVYEVAPKRAGEMGTRRIYMPVFNNSENFWGQGTRQFVSVNLPEALKGNIVGLHTMDTKGFTLLPSMELEIEEAEQEPKAK